MLRVLTLLIFSCVTLRAATPYHFCLTTNDLISIYITPDNSRMSAILTGLSTTNSDWGLFLYQTNSAAAVDWLNVFKPASQNGRWIRATVFDVSLGFRIAGGATSGQFLRGNGTEFASASIQTSDLGSGTPDGTKFLRDDRVFAVPPGSVTPANLTAGTGLTFPSGTGVGAVLTAVEVALSAGSITSLGLADTAVQPARQIISGGGLTGGGTLAADRTLVVGAGTGITVNADDVAIANTAVTPASYGSTTQSSTFTVDQQGRLTAAGNATIAFPTATSTQVQCGSGNFYDLTTSFAAIDMDGGTDPSLSLAAGTWFVIAHMSVSNNGAIADADNMYLDLYNSTDAASLSGSHVAVEAVIGANLGYLVQMNSSALVTLAGTKTILMRAYNGTGARGRVLGIYTSIQAVKIAN